jgi:uncharacterized protein (TIGR03000 family)
MCKRGLSLTACGALALLLTAAETCSAQVVFFPVGRGGTAMVGGRNFGFFPLNVGPTYYPRSNYYSNPGYGQTNYNSFYYSAPTPLYYGAAQYPAAYTPTTRLVSPPAGVGLRPDPVAEAAYSAPVYPVQAPSYPSIYPISPPLAAVTDKTAKVEVRVPDDAEIWFEGQKTSQTGTDRTYSSPSLDAGQDYLYEVRARWSADGKPIDQTRKVTVHAGDHVLVDFLRP